MLIWQRFLTFSLKPFRRTSLITLLLAARPVMIIIWLMQHNTSYRLIFFNLDIYTYVYAVSTCCKIDRVYDSIFWRLYDARMDDVIPTLHWPLNIQNKYFFWIIKSLSFFSACFRQCHSCGSWMQLVWNKQIAQPVRRMGIKINLSRPGSNIVVYTDDNRALAVNAT